VKLHEDEIEYSGCSENSEIQNQDDSLELDLLRKITLRLVGLKTRRIAMQFVALVNSMT
jgi:hypothetical protein